MRNGPGRLPQRLLARQAQLHEIAGELIEQLRRVLVTAQRAARRIGHVIRRAVTEQVALGPVADIARITSRPDRNHHRLRAERSTLELAVSAVSAASARTVGR